MSRKNGIRTDGERGGLSNPQKRSPASRPGSAASDCLDAVWSRHHAEWRDSAQVASQWEDAAALDQELLRFRARGDIFEIIDRLGITLLVTREYEHLLIALSVVCGRPRVSFFKMPHPSGLTVDRKRGVVHVASTRNPNQVYELKPVTGAIERQDVEVGNQNDARPLVPVSSSFYAGCMYLHDLAIIGGDLYGNSVGQNAVVKLETGGVSSRVWWPLCIESKIGPNFGQNYIQLNSIAAGCDIASSYFSASSDSVSTRRPGHRNYPVDRRGVVFSGRTREAVIRGLTRPHSARLIGSKVWVDNSGYGEFGFGSGRRGGDLFQPVVKLPGWTRGLCVKGDIAFVGTSRVIPRFSQYAPGLDVDKSVCGIHAVDLKSGAVLGSLTWPVGNQIFAIEWIPQSYSHGFPFLSGKRLESEKRLFYAFSTQDADLEISQKKSAKNKTSKQRT